MATAGETERERDLRNAALEEAAKVTSDAADAARSIRRREVAREMDIATLRIRDLKR